MLRGAGNFLYNTASGTLQAVSGFASDKAHRLLSGRLPGAVNPVLAEFVKDPIETYLAPGKSHPDWGVYGRLHIFLVEVTKLML